MASLATHTITCAAFQLVPGLKHNPSLLAQQTEHHSASRQAPFFISASAAASGAGAAVDQVAMEQTLKTPMYLLLANDGPLNRQSLTLMQAVSWLPRRAGRCNCSTSRAHTDMFRCSNTARFCLKSPCHAHILIESVDALQQPTKATFRIKFGTVKHRNITRIKQAN
jgi:hypothetical protein